MEVNTVTLPDGTELTLDQLRQACEAYRKMNKCRYEHNSNNIEQEDGEVQTLMEFLNELMEIDSDDE